MLNKYSWRMDIIILTTLLGGLFFFLLGVRPLSVPDEANYAEITREMLINHDYITPYLNGIKFFDKPILLYWFGVGCFKIFGIHLWSLRTVNALTGLGGCLATYVTARKLYDRTTGFFAAFILGTSVLYFVLLHLYTMDLIVTVFIEITLFAFILGIKSKKHDLQYFMCAAIASGLAVLTKGLIGILLPGIVILVWSSVYQEWKWFNKVTLIVCFSLFLMIVMPWHVLAAFENPSFLYFYFIEHHLIRFESGAVGHIKPFWYYLPVMCWGFYPWIVFLPEAIYVIARRHSQYKIECFFVFSVLLIFIFFTLSKAKLLPYILVVFPPLAIWIAYYLREKIQNKDLNGIRKAYGMLLLSAIGCSPIFLFFTRYYPVANPALTNIYLWIVGCIIILGSTLSYIFSKNNLRYAIISTCMMAAAIDVLLIAAIPSMDSRTTLPLANVLKQIAHPDDEIISLGHYFYDLPFYLEKRIAVVNANHLFTYGLSHQLQHNWMIDADIFKMKWLSNRRVFALMDLQDYENIPLKYKALVFYPMAQTKKYILVSNCKPVVPKDPV